MLVILMLLCIPTLALAWSLNEKWQLLPVAIATALFLGYFSPVSLLILSFTSCTSFYLLQKLGNSAGVAIVVSLQALAVFLFFKLGVAHDNFSMIERLLPLGLSYYSFRQVHYAVEAYKQKLPRHTVWDYLSYMFFLPTILVGPINLFQDFHRDHRRRRWDSELFSEGLERILFGAFKITVLGNYLMSYKMVNIVQELQTDRLWLSTYLDTVRFAGNAYFQFAGFSDIAIGLSMLFGFRIVENFNFPFLATNISDFWQRWHISLSNWCRDYVYYPVSFYSRMPYLGVVISMLVLGLWHEISFKFIVWGAAHALAINCWHWYNHSAFQQLVRRVFPFPKLLGILLTVHFVIFSFIITRGYTWPEIFHQFKILFLL